MGNRTNGDSLRFKSIQCDYEGKKLSAKKLGEGIFRTEDLVNGNAKYIALPVRTKRVKSETSDKSMGE